MTLPSLVTTSPQRADPLTWILALNLPLLASVATGFGGIALAVLGAAQGVSPFAILLATALSVLGCLIVVRAARPQRSLVRPIESVLPMCLALASMAVSALGHRGSEITLAEWSGTLGFATVLIALVPYVPPLVTGAWGLVGAVVASAVARVTFESAEVGHWSLLLAASSMPLHVGVVGAVFSGMIVAALTRWRALPYDREESPDGSVAFTARLREHGTPMAVSDDVIALLGRAASGGRVSARDRTDAAALAADIRADLVRALNRSWLDTIPQRNRLLVEDPGNIANQMTREQRAAVHSLITAALESPVLDGEELLVELRSLDDGTTAVALSMDISLPEGRRMMMFAPYFVSLKASVEDMEWAAGEQLLMRFKLQAPPDARGR